MAILTFAPGPSKVYDKLPDYFQEAYQQGILSANHRSGVFMDLYKDTERLFKEKLAVPEDYKLLFTSSATENWEIITQSLVLKASFHIYSGSFGKKWFGFAQNIIPETAALVFDKNESLTVNDLEIGNDFDLIAITQNETSNATQVTNDTIAAIGNKYPDKMLAIDTTSSMAGIFLDFSLADIWYASVQKCFGLPAGLGILIVSPKAIERAKAKGEKGRYNSLNFMLENAANYQTHYTPNVLNIYLLNRVLADLPNIAKVNAKTEERMRILEEIVEQSPALDFLVSNEATRSRTVLGVGGEEKFIKQIKAEAEEQGMQMGSGYGPLKPTSFRIANFPALNDDEFEQLIAFLKAY
ncbi:aminotransferase class V-fold PLP-dependent enzyme [Cyclobacterium marinum]|uniref:phosphoserine transaminase n=1 Tax=Cyclobacterium marinum (strain ATCC 25205 / DSM 745 / LMG 13164 / NCIMB 1802) TaxID=880070 RepID=G0IVU8_CYCMS|nr:aminotransferase class V [Cyclobacterium marinum DSM 745]|tara:strand:+ start:80919 stop:81980 length:1062 start_codon:yes stop_codon:yes gene_type:complete